MSIKLSKSKAPDKQVWTKTKTGLYSTKTGYRVALEAIKGSPSTTRNPISWIPDVWELHIPPKIKLFIWRIFKGALATGENLAKRGLNSAIECGRCGQRESTDHILWSCPFAKEIWRETPILMETDVINIPSFEEAWPKLKRTKALPPTGVTHGPVTAWLVWFLCTTRNSSIFNQRWNSREEVINNAMRAAREWIVAQKMDKNAVKYPISMGVRVELDVVCRSDAAWKECDNAAGLGWMFVLADGSKVEQRKVEKNVEVAVVAEALAMREAMTDALERGFLSVSFETDCSELTRMMNSGVANTNLYGVVQDLLYLKSYLCPLVWLLFHDLKMLWPMVWLRKR